MTTRKCTVISDTHGYHHELVLPGGDILLHCGDFSNIGSMKETLDFLLWYANVPIYQHKVLIAGNHDLCLDGKKSKRGRMLEYDEDMKRLILDVCARLNIKYLENDTLNIAGLRIYGSPYTPSFNDWAFQIPTVDQELKMFQNIPKNLHILLTHCPPHSILDVGGRNYEHLGSKGLQEIVLKRKPKFHCFGHIHESHGVKKFHDITFINASYCDMPYNKKNSYQEFEVEV